MDYTRSEYFPFGFHLTREAWARYNLNGLLREYRGNLSAIDESIAVRAFTERVNAERTGADALQPIGAGQALTLGLLTEVMRYLVDYYCLEQVPGAMGRGVTYTREQRGPLTVEVTPLTFVHLFPPQAVQLEGKLEGEFLKEQEGPRTNDEIAVREMILLSLAAANPALKNFQPLLSDEELRRRAPYLPFVLSLETFFAQQPPVDLTGESLFECLRAPMLASPDSLEGQLDFILKRWARILPASLLTRLHVVQGIVREETRDRGFVQGTSEVLHFGPGAADGDTESYAEPERFSADADWMSNVVMIAKTVYVWLDQLSKKHQRHIQRIDQIPDEELDQLARWGFNGLWLIGLWERSPASEDIKRIMGNSEAVASAYSLYDYQIAADLGGDTAYDNLRDRARARGIRLASDMVPNHTGIYSRWVVEHPDWFLASDHSPFPGYQFTGTNLSRDARVGIYLEDGYWTHRDAAVVFKRVDHHTGSEKFIYHGNDGTSMPWNDTAQLNYLNPALREAVIRTILHVARKFPIIRFDAAMTLAKKHFQRLWFPKHGEAGAIPSRAEHSMSRAEFDRLIPEEFWREVVDRIAREAPDTLLLAEAFWMMEGYFVRTLGMHRVYNSAFMNMLKMENNAEYRSTTRNVLEFSPEILKRFVNFMNNPDERTAVEQFGRGDKYIGVCLLMVTMPGLPMFGHGQIEGYTEKYGMEYRRAYWDEQVDQELLRRHEAEIFPLMRKRYLFSGVSHFAFYDFNVQGGHIDDNVFAYSNRAGDERSIVIYNNAYGSTQGWMKNAVSTNIGRADEPQHVFRSLGEALGLRVGENVFYLFRDQRTGLEYIRAGRQLQDEGLFVQLSGYQYHVFLEFREIYEEDGTWGKLAWNLEGRGVPDCALERRRLNLAPLHDALRRVYDLEQATIGKLPADARKADWPGLENALRDFLRTLSEFTSLEIDAPKIAKQVVFALKDLPLICTHAFADLPDDDHGWTQLDVGAEPARHCSVGFFFLVLNAANRAWCVAHDTQRSDALLDDWLLHLVMEESLRKAGRNDWGAAQDLRLIRILLSQVRDAEPSAAFWEKLIADETVAAYVLLNRHEDAVYLNKEQLHSLVIWISLATALTLPDALQGKRLQNDDVKQHAASWTRWSKVVLDAAEEAGYEVGKLSVAVRKALTAPVSTSEQ